MSPGGYVGPPGGPPPGASTPIMPSPQDSNTSSGESMYTMMKPSSTMSGDMCNTSDGSIGSMGPGPGPNGPGPGGSGPGPGGPGPPGNGNGPGGPSGIIGNGPGDQNMEMKNSPANGPGTPQNDSSGNMGDFGMGSYGSNGGNVSKIVFRLRLAVGQLFGSCLAVVWQSSGSRREVVMQSS